MILQPERPIRMSAAIMAHPRRADMVRQLLDHLGREVTVVWDEHNDRWDTGRRAMLAYDPSCTHHAVIQDDVVIGRDLLTGLEKALGRVPSDVPLCGYVGRVRPNKERVHKMVQKARIASASFITMSELLWGPLIVVPVEHVDAMIAYCDPLNIANYDMRLSRYWEGRSRVWYTWPSVVDHADTPSLVPGRTGSSRRVAHEFCGEETSVLDLPWDGPVISGH